MKSGRGVAVAIAGETHHNAITHQLVVASALDLREVFRAIAANIREVIHGDAVAVSLPDQTSGKSRIFAMDFPHGKGVIKEELLVTPSAAVKKAMDTLKPDITRGC